MSGTPKNDVAVLACYEKEHGMANGVSRKVLACYEKERVEACPEECSHVTKKSVSRRVQIRVLACYEKAHRPGADRPGAFGHDRRYAQDRGRTRPAGAGHRGRTDRGRTMRALLGAIGALCAVGASGVFSPGRFLLAVGVAPRVKP